MEESVPDFRCNKLWRTESVCGAESVASTGLASHVQNLKSKDSLDRRQRMTSLLI